VGFVVDDAIVMLENIMRHVEAGETVMDAALKGSKEIGFTILSMTISLVAVFLPVFFMGGLIGRLLHEFAVTIGMSILISGFVALTLTPMLASRFVRPHGKEQHGRLYQISERGFTGMLEFYRRTLTYVLRHRKFTLFASGVVLLLTAFLFKIIPTGFLPSEDIGAIFVTTEAAQGISFDAMKQHQLEVADIVLKDKRVEGFMSSIGAGGSSVSGNQGRIFMKLKPRSGARHTWTRSFSNCGLSSARCRGSRHSFRTRLPSGSAVRSPRACTSSRSRVLIPRNFTRMRRSLNQNCGSCPCSRT
jgi:HAE1 family hydrophobic/amphiphilic exporter-1